MTTYRQLLPLLVGAGVEFIIVGGVAASAHGSARLTEDLDIIYARSPKNLTLIISALAPYKPYLRGAPPGLPFDWSERTLKNGLNFTLTTSLGAIDLLGEITGGGSYADLLPYSERLPLYGIECQCLGLEKLIQVKRAAGRPKDLESIAELEAILEERLR